MLIKNKKKTKRYAEWNKIAIWQKHRKYKNYSTIEGTLESYNDYDIVYFALGFWGHENESMTSHVHMDGMAINIDLTWDRLD